MGSKWWKKNARRYTQLGKISLVFVRSTSITYTTKDYWSLCVREWNGNAAVDPPFFLQFYRFFYQPSTNSVQEQKRKQKHGKVKKFKQIELPMYQNRFTLNFSRNTLHGDIVFRWRKSRFSNANQITAKDNMIEGNVLNLNDLMRIKFIVIFNQKMKQIPPFFVLYFDYCFAFNGSCFISMIANDWNCASWTHKHSLIFIPMNDTVRFSSDQRYLQFPNGKKILFYFNLFLYTLPLSLLS